jgi:surfactin synthase thioesterase subunit
MTPPTSLAPHVVWFHHAGGHGDSYRALAASLPLEWRHTFLTYPGRGQGPSHQAYQAHLACTDLRELVAHLLPRVQAVAHAPFAFFGHSMGALVAYETARQMQQWGLPLPCWLGLSGHRAPHQTWPPKPAMHRWPDQTLHARLSELGALPTTRLEPDYLALVRADLCACETYEPPSADAAPPLACAVSTFTGDADPMVHPDDMRGWACRFTPPAGLPARHHVLPGGHFYLGGLERRQVAERIASDLTTHLPPSLTPRARHHAERTRRSHHPCLPH